jgi:hypothetical protein
MGMFKGLAKVTVSSRLPDPKLGVGDFLLNSLRWKTARDGKKRVQAVLTCLRGRTEGGNEKGDKINIPIFSGDYFLTEIKRWLLACLGVDEEEVIEVACGMLGDEVKNMDEADRAEAAWEYIATQATAGTEENGDSQDAGIFDNQVVIELETKVKPAKPIEGEFVKNDAGEFVPKMGRAFVNTYANKKVSLASLADDLDEKDMVRFFGSAERFAELLDGEG